eukprot:CAMPEP_0196582922 /NCGR_PEP_ID=MMETSP1081-20130531/41277_1 /TAXON_ID=36882 /ORGANISM="Pyramimonas amylifera, Strain CCMP720" /LENGTH=290 /DNA_ID=CAMNT_0041903645 /DNA_START=228 /DNA_END=1097 /DNA_ORIENTATION=-
MENLAELRKINERNLMLTNTVNKNAEVYRYVEDPLKEGSPDKPEIFQRPNSVIQVTSHTQDQGLFLDQEATTHGGRGDESKEGEGDELSRLKKRNFEAYSEGHRRMYMSALTLIGGQDTLRSANILEVGVGIGWGLGKMMNEVKLRSYVGVEPCKTCVRYVKEQVVGKWIAHRKSEIAKLSPRKQKLYLAEMPTFELFASTFLEVPQETLAKGFHGDTQSDFSFCIEVVEHVAPHERVDFFKQMRALTNNTLFFSTPNKATHQKDGALTSSQWHEVVLRAGFTTVSIIEW